MAMYILDTLMACPLPQTLRGESLHVDIDSLKERLIYSNGKEVYIRSLQVTISKEFIRATY